MSTIVWYRLYLFPVCSVRSASLFVLSVCSTVFLRKLYSVTELAAAAASVAAAKTSFVVVTITLWVCVCVPVFWLPCLLSILFKAWRIIRYTLSMCVCVVMFLFFSLFFSLSLFHLFRFSCLSSTLMWLWLYSIGHGPQWRSVRFHALYIRQLLIVIQGDFFPGFLHFWTILKSNNFRMDDFRGFFQSIQRSLFIDEDKSNGRFPSFISS